MFRYTLPLIAFVTLPLLPGCGGGGGSSTTSPPVTTTPDMGTITMADTVNQYQLKNVNSGLVLGISGQSQTVGANVVQETNSNSTDSMWHFVPNVYADDRMNIENMLTHQVIGFSSSEDSAGLPAASAANQGAQAAQFSDTGTDDEDWSFYLLKDGNYLIKNHNSGYYLEVANSGTTSTATIDQGARATTGTGCTCQEWTLVKTANAAYPAPRTVTGAGIYVHDPYMALDASTGTYWLYGTHQTLATSTDLTTFTPYEACTPTQKGGFTSCPIIGPDFPAWTGLQTPLSWNNGLNTDVWAPSMMFVSGTYYLYYAVPWAPDTLGGEALIGLATSTTPQGPWTDDGFQIKSWSNSSTPPSGWGFVNTTGYNAIDPAPFVDADGNWWLVFGSWFDGMHILKLDPATGKPAAGAEMITVAYRYWGEEGSFIFPWVVNGTQYYYYFAPINPCCSPTSTYRIIAGRSTNPAGPYFDRGGVDLTQNGGTILLSTHGNIIGPGGQSVFTDMVSGVATPTLVYHYYDGNNNGVPTLGINRIGFTADGWPYVE